MQGIHLTAAVAKPLTDIAGPIGTVVRSVAKASAKISSCSFEISMTKLPSKNIQLMNFKLLNLSK